MKHIKKTIINTLWFVIEVIGIFVIVQVVRYAFGNWDAPALGLFLIGIASLLFIAAYLFARFKDKRDGDKPSSKAITSILS
jgi:formate-dependent nitrite reductase membrane component NrfD